MKKPPFNWHDHIDQLIASARLFSWNKELQNRLFEASEKAQDWQSCACGSLHPEIELNEFGVPIDKDLSNLGANFSIHMEYAASCYHEEYSESAIDHLLEAKKIIQQIDAREHELLKEKGIELDYDTPKKHLKLYTINAQGNYTFDVEAYNEQDAFRIIEHAAHQLNKWDPECIDGSIIMENLELKDNAARVIEVRHYHDLPFSDLRLETIDAILVEPTESE